MKCSEVQTCSFPFVFARGYVLDSLGSIITQPSSRSTLKSGPGPKRATAHNSWVKPIIHSERTSSRTHDIRSTVAGGRHDAVAI